MCVWGMIILGCLIGGGKTVVVGVIERHNAARAALLAPHVQGQTSSSVVSGPNRPTIQPMSDADFEQMRQKAELRRQKKQEEKRQADLLAKKKADETKTAAAIAKKAADDLAKKQALEKERQGMAALVKRSNAWTWESLIGPDWHAVNKDWQVKDIRWINEAPTKDETAGTSEFCYTLRHVGGMTPSNYRVIVMLYDEHMHIIGPSQDDLHSGNTGMVRLRNTIDSTTGKTPHPTYVTVDIAQFKDVK